MKTMVGASLAVIGILLALGGIPIGVVADVLFMKSQYGNMNDSALYHLGILVGAGTSAVIMMAGVVVAAIGITYSEIDLT